MASHQPNPGNRNNRTHGRPIPEPPSAPILGRFVYEVYGSQWSDDDDAGDSFAGQLFQGMRRDPSVPLTDFAPRHFSPSQARWIDREPSGYVDGMEAHIVESDNPTLEAYIVESDNPMLEESPPGE